MARNVAWSGSLKSVDDICEAVLYDYFLVADTQLYKRLCLPVRWSIRWSVGPFVTVIELKRGKMSVFGTFCACFFNRQLVQEYSFNWLPNSDY